MNIAGIGARSYAYLIDWHIRVGGALGWLLLVLLLQYLVDTNNPSAGWWFVYAPAAVFYVFYHPVIELCMNGNTPGKHYAKVKIVTIDGGIPTARKILVRNLLRLIDGLPALYAFGISCCFITKQQVRMGDLAAGTVLVYTEESDSAISGFVSQRQTLEKLLARWDELEEHVRDQLARKALDKLGVSHKTGDLKHRLQSELERLD